MSSKVEAAAYFSRAGGERILLTLWIGALWAIGFLAVPTIFAGLEERQIAGMLAGKMFTTLNYMGLFCGSLLLLSEGLRTESIKRSLRFWILVVMLLIIAISEFGIQAQMAELKQAGLTFGSQAAQTFGKLHFISTVLYIINSIAGFFLVLSSSE